MPDVRPETLVADLIAANTDHVRGTDLFTGPPKPSLDGNGVPVNCIFVYSMFSFMPKNYLGSSRKAEREFRVTILVRYGPDQYEAGQNVARACWEGINQQDLSANTGYVVSLMNESDPSYLGMDDTDNHRWEMTARLVYIGSP